MQRLLRVRAGQQGTRAQRGCTVSARRVIVLRGWCAGIVWGSRGVVMWLRGLRPVSTALDRPAAVAQGYGGGCSAGK